MWRCKIRIFLDNTIFTCPKKVVAKAKFLMKLWINKFMRIWGWCGPRGGIHFMLIKDLPKLKVNYCHILQFNLWVLTQRGTSDLTDVRSEARSQIRARGTIFLLSENLNLIRWDSRGADPRPQSPSGSHVFVLSWLLYYNQFCRRQKKSYSYDFHLRFFMHHISTIWLRMFWRSEKDENHFNIRMILKECEDGKLKYFVTKLPSFAFPQTIN